MLMTVVPMDMATGRYRVEHIGIDDDQWRSFTINGEIHVIETGYNIVAVAAVLLCILFFLLVSAALVLPIE